MSTNDGGHYQAIHRSVRGGRPDGYMPPPDHFEVDEMTAYFGWLERNEAADQFYGRRI